MTAHDAAYCCREERRAETVRDAKDGQGAFVLNGIDYLEVSADQTTLQVHFLHPLPGQPGGVPADAAAITKDNVAIDGGDRIRGIRVLDATSAGDVLTVTVSAPGDFSPYRLRLLKAGQNDAPDGIDPRLSQVTFSFKAGCVIRFDCGPPDACPPQSAGAQASDYLAKDYDSFRQLMLDRLATTIPGWRERSPADLQIALVELLAFVADRLSYEQDAVATEAYLSTARRRLSVRRHARLLGYRMHEGCAARAFVAVRVGTGPGGSTEPGDVAIDAGRQFATGPPDASDTLVFTALHALTAKAAHNDIAFYTWSDQDCYLPRGATRATLAGAPPLSLAAGDFLLFEEVAGPHSGKTTDANPAHRHVVRLTEVTPSHDPLDGSAIVEIAWSAADALPFPLCINTVTCTRDGGQQRTVCGVGRGNIVLAEHGRPVTGVRLSPLVDVVGRFRPALPEGRPTYAVAYDRTAPATRLLDLDPRQAYPDITISDGDRGYNPVLDLLASAPSAAEFVVEIEEDGETSLRFGDDTYGRRPDPDVPLTADYRVGHGSIGNVGPGAIDRLLPAETVVTVSNPMAACGGTDPEPTEKVRTDAPHAFRIQERAVTEDDYGTIVTQRVTGVQRAAGRMRWTGSWYTAFVSVDALGGGQVDEELTGRVRAMLDRYRMAGVDVEVSRPVPVPLELELVVYAQPDRFNTDVERDVLEVLSSQTLPDGRRGLFHPDNFTFGTPVYLSSIYSAVLALPGVATVRATTFRRYGQPDRGELADGVIRVHDLEIAQLANDPDVPERGVQQVSVAGGR